MSRVRADGLLLCWHRLRTNYAGLLAHAHAHAALKAAKEAEEAQEAEHGRFGVILPSLRAIPAHLLNQIKSNQNAETKEAALRLDMNSKEYADSECINCAACT